MARRTAIYARISSDDGLALGVERRRQDCAALALRLGWTVAHFVTDNDVSAYNGKRRPGYERLLAELEAGTVDALIVWDVDRLTRTPVELEHIIDLAERRGIALASVGGEIDLATPQGRLTARIKASVARHEVEQSSRRIRRTVLERAEAGQPHGRIAYGWQREVLRDDQGRRVGSRDVLLPGQAAVVHEIARRLVAGESLRSVSLDLSRRGVRTPNGKKRWDPTMTRQIVLRERNAGLRRHQGRVIGKGTWEPIFSEDTFARVQALLTDPTRRTVTSSERRYLLSGLALCGACGHSVRVLVPHGGRPPAYVCPVCFGVRRKQAEVDRLITTLIVARLGQPDAVAVLTDQPDVEPAVEEAAKLRARLSLAADQFSDGVIDGPQLARITANLRPRLETAEAEIRAASSAPDLLDLAASSEEEARRRWESAPLERRRAAISLLLTVRILPIGRTGRAAFDPSGVEVDWCRPGAAAAALSARA